MNSCAFHTNTVTWHSCHQKPYRKVKVNISGVHLRKINIIAIYSVRWSRPSEHFNLILNFVCRFDDLRWFNNKEFGLPVNYWLNSSRLKSFNKTTFYILNLHLFILEWKYVATLFTKMIIIYLYFLCFFSGKYHSDGLFIPYETNFYSISIKKKRTKYVAFWRDEFLLYCTVDFEYGFMWMQLLQIYCIRKFF